MPRTWKTVWGVVLLGVSALVVEASPPSEALLPESTVGFVSVPDVQKLIDQFNETQLGQLMQDPSMEAFLKDLRRQFDQRWSNVGDKLGLSIDDIRGLAGGELAFAMMSTEKGQAPVAMLVDVTGNVDQTKQVLEKASANLIREGARRSQVAVAGLQVTVFDLPDDGRGVQLDRVGYVLKDALLIVSDNLEVIRGILQRSGGTGGSLAGAKPFQQVIEKIGKDAGEAAPQLRWYVQPLGYLQAVDTLRDERQPRRGQTFVDVFQEQGFDAIQGAGGYVDFAVDDYQVVHRTAVYAPKPWDKAMKMMAFPNVEAFEPQAWVPRDVASYTAFSVELLQAFDNFGPLFDALFGEGETGVWEDVLESLKQDPHGPKIDLRNELVAQLGNRVSAVTAYQLPITPTSERLLFAIEAPNEPVVAAAIEKTLKDDKEIRQRKHQQYVIWETIPPKKAEVPAVSLQLPGLPGRQGRDAGRSGQGQESALLPNAAVTVAHGRLLIASHYDFLIQVLDSTDERQSLARTVEHQQVAAVLEKLSAGGISGWNFTRTDEQARPTYELIRQGKMPQSETILGRLLNTIFEADKKGVAREQEIEGGKMPDYELVRRHLGPAGTIATTQEDGWFIKGMMLAR